MRGSHNLHARREDGFTMFEMVIVMAIIAILLGLGVWSVASARKSGGGVLGVATARAYEQAIDRFAASHGGEVPAESDTDWPGGAEAKQGPVAVIMGEKKHYLRSVPEAVQDGRVLVGVGAPPAAPNNEVTVTYRTDGPGYRLEVRVPGRDACAIYGKGGAPGGSEPPACG